MTYVRSRTKVVALLTTLLLIALVGACTDAQGQDAGAASSARVFPQIGPDVKAIKRDSSGHYYILAKPANVVWVFAPDGQLAGKIPNNTSAGAIRYASDIDLDSTGNLLVADRGANAVEIFRPDGSLVSKIPVFAPLSVVALPDGKFAVVTLRSKYLVNIFNESGSAYYSFGDRSEADPGASPETLLVPGKIYGDSAGYIYFAFTSMADPMVRKYDRSGYMEFAAPLPIPEIEAASKPEDRLEFGINFGQMNISDQVGGWATLGTSGTLQFGSGMGTGFGQRMGRGFGGGGGMPGGPMPGGAGGFGNPLSMGNEGGGAPAGPAGMNGATFFGQGTVRKGEFHFNLGAGLGRGGFGRGAGTGTNGSRDNAAGQASLLQFDSGGFSAGPGGAIAGASASDADTEILEADPSDILNSPDATLGADEADATANVAFAEPGLQPGMFAGGMFFRPRGGFGGPHGGGLGGPPGGGSLGGHGFGGFGSGRAFAPGAPGPGSGAMPFGRPGFGPPGGHFVFNMYNVVASVRLNLDRPAQTVEKNPKLTAIAVDPATGESWAAIGSQLIHLGADGSLLGSYYMATPDGTPLHPNAILVEPDRLLIADDPLGIFSFARPDHSAPARTSLSARAVQSQDSH
jgi:hypothetical protein